MRAEQLNAIHRAVHEKPGCRNSEVCERVGVEIPRGSELLRELVRQERLERYKPDGHPYFLYRSIAVPPMDLKFTATREPTPPALLLARLWLPGHLELSA